MKNFILPGVSENFELNQALIILHDNHPEFFINNFNIECVYGNFNMCLWNGGRVFNDYNTLSKEDIESIYNFYKEYNIPVRLTMTNFMLEKKHLQDRFSNLLMEIFNDPMNQVVIASPLLEEYIRNKYPNYKICSSTTKCLKNAADIKKELNSGYYQVCLDYNINHKKELLESFNENEKNTTEFLCNAICPPGCKYRQEHYKLNGISTNQLGRRFSVPFCPITSTCYSEHTFNYKNNISPEEIETYYEPLGFSHFKLEGRTLPNYEVLMIYIHYLIKPQYKEMAIYNILDYINHNY